MYPQIVELDKIKGNPGSDQDEGAHDSNNNMMLGPGYQYGDGEQMEDQNIEDRSF